MEKMKMEKMKSRHRPAHIPKATPKTGGWHLLIRMVALTVLPVWTSLPFLPGAALTSSVTAQAAQQNLNSWSSRGPWGAYVTNIAIAPSNPDILYVWTEYDVFKSTDGGGVWNHVGRADHSARYVSIDTFNPETLYVTPNAFPTAASKSTDGGASWNAIGPSDSPVAFLAMDPANPTTLYALDGKFRLSKSTDGGATWSRAGNGLPEHTGPRQILYAVLAVSPDNPQTLFAAFPTDIAENQGLYRSTDGGANWSRVGVGPFRNVAMLQLVVAEARPNVLYARTVEGCYRSTDYGVNWSAISLPNPLVGPLAIDPENAALVYVGTSDGGVFKSTDGGTSWTNANVGLHNSPVNKLMIDPRDTTKLYAATASGVFKSGDGGASWRDASSGVSARVGFLATPGAGVLLAVGWELFRSVDSGGTWERAGLPGLAHTCATDPNHPNLIYAFASTEGFLYKSTDGGASWSATPVDLRGVYLNTLAIAPSNPAILYASVYYDSYEEYAVIESTDGGASWARISKGLRNASRLVLDPVNPNTLYALAYTQCDVGGFYDYCSAAFKSTDGGVSWYESNSALPLGERDLEPTEINALAVDPENPRILYVALSNRTVYKSSDGGLTWKITGLKPKPGEEKSYHDNNLVLDPSDSKTLYVGYGNVVYKSTDGGATWVDISPDLPADLDILVLVIDPSGTSLHVGTNRGVFDYHLATPCAEPLSPANQSFESAGGPGVVEVAATDVCSWSVESLVDWIRVTSASGGAGRGKVNYFVSPNDSTAPRTGRVGIASRVLTITQAGLPVRIDRASVLGKKLFIVGENFDPGAVILLNGEPQLTKNDSLDPKTSLIGRKAGKKVKAGDKLQVRNPNGSLSAEFNFTGL
jgi:photosystem II stability/assembly factor-like uncharacterized protein